MIEIKENDYREIAYRLKNAIADSDFFNGSIEYDTDRFYSTLTATAIVYRTNTDMPDGYMSQIQDIVPVWWSFTTYRLGDACSNDFGFDCLKPFI